MAKKDSKFKVKVSEDNLSGKFCGLKAIANKYEHKSNKQVCDWVKLYKESPKLLYVENRGRKPLSNEEYIIKHSKTYKEGLKDYVETHPGAYSKEIAK